MDKNAKKEMAKQYARKQKDALIASLPFALSWFQPLFDYLDEMLSSMGCDDTLKFTTEFLQEQHLPIETSLAWMRENGGYCDCEVLANIEEKISELE
jgi:hypothetical protein